MGGSVIKLEGWSFLRKSQMCMCVCARVCVRACVHVCGEGSGVIRNKLKKVINRSLPKL